jgi:hypothetical protein
MAIGGVNTTNALTSNPPDDSNKSNKKSTFDIPIWVVIFLSIVFILFCLFMLDQFAYNGIVVDSIVDTIQKLLRSRRTSPGFGRRYSRRR